MPPEVAKMIIGTLYIVVRTMLKLSKLPDADRAELEQARASIEKVIGAYIAAEKTLNEFRF